MTFKPSMAFRAKAKAGEAMVEAFLKKNGKRLGASLHTHQGPPLMAWSKIGSDKKETLVLIHGFGDRKESFYFIAEFLKERLNLVIPDLPGFGNSGMDPDLVYGLDNYIDWLDRFIEQTGLDTFHLAGCSMGGAIAAKLAAQFPSRVKTLSLVGSAGFYLPGKPSIYDEVIAGSNIFYISSPGDFETLQSRIFRKSPPLPTCVKEYMILKAMGDRKWLAKIFDELVDMDSIQSGKISLEQASLNHLCKDITMPVMLFWGRHDSLLPCETAPFVEELLPRAQVHIYEEYGHVPHLEGPRQLAGDMLDFIYGSAS
ncbi:alpha/beta hydrolase [Desulfobacter hydrogenophilus]|uniref:Alpha/beta hydrolase n=1 Tax=Desulfobacter hydrogenophilus TaxID=2291 RepID=A0A328FA41_9BACT|nr:alpha/beta hydrolase [Desulfobacter hydrogenophilus]NDY72968.1 alpha/beta hydrolase [Desulfobacter hydrogenophilus]QBH12469.1 alpha/beta hydrolase [Desulfobacter hydrogenophilus]RAM01501.1 alpha/beta hydrolase [Desulfobacter hydrogenophilus]